MSASKPMEKKPRLAEPQPNPLRKAVSTLDLRKVGTEEESDPLTSSQIRPTSSPVPTAPVTEETGVNRPRLQGKAHEKGHKVSMLKEVWDRMDKKDFLPIADFSDIWLQPTGVSSLKGVWGDVTLKEVVFAPHIKSRTAVTKMSGEDLCKILYLCDCLTNELQAIPRLPYEEWLNGKIAACVKVKGPEESMNRCKLAHFVITEDREFTFYPTCLRGNFGFFFHKICYHSYKTTDLPVTTKFDNPSMIRCCATKGKFEYIYEVRLFPLPDGWMYEPTPAQPAIDADPIASVVF